MRATVATKTGTTLGGFSGEDFRNDSRGVFIDLAFAVLSGWSLRLLLFTGLVGLAYVAVARPYERLRVDFRKLTNALLPGCCC